jgi:hypothetical protein
VSVVKSNSVTTLDNRLGVLSYRKENQYMGLVSRYKNHNDLVLDLLKKVYQRVKSDYADLDTYEMKQIKRMIETLQERKELREKHIIL